MGAPVRSFSWRWRGGTCPRHSSSAQEPALVTGSAPPRCSSHPSLVLSLWFPPHTLACARDRTSRRRIVFVARTKVAHHKQPRSLRPPHGYSITLRRTCCNFVKPKIFPFGKYLDDVLASLEARSCRQSLTRQLPLTCRHPFTDCVSDQIAEHPSFVLLNVMLATGIPRQRYESTRFSSTGDLCKASRDTGSLSTWELSMTCSVCLRLNQLLPFPSGNTRNK